MDYFHLQAGRDALLAQSSLALAHLGDSVFEVMVRSWLCLKGPSNVKKLHKATVGRNTAPHSVPKAASREEYQTATALEALFGWLYLQGETQRLNQLFSAMMEE